MSLKAFFISLVLHGAVLVVLFLSPQRPIAIEVEVRTIDVAAGEKKINFRPAPKQPRLGSESYRKTYRKLGDTLSAENYLERLHRHVDPNWRMFVDRSRSMAKCSTTLNIDADAKGTVLLVVPLHNTCPPKLLRAAMDAIWYANLLPPPKLLLDSRGILKLEWSFVLKPKPG